MGKNLQVYRKNAQVLAAALKQAGCVVLRGRNSPTCGSERRAAWARGHCSSICCTLRASPAHRARVGAEGEGYFRLSAFGDADATKRAAGAVPLALGMLANG